LRPRNFTNQINVFLAKALGEFVNGGSEDTGGARIHMFYRVNTIVINISIGNPKLIDLQMALRAPRKISTFQCFCVHEKAAKLAA
jgi:hypothetical protein